LLARYGTLSLPVRSRLRDLLFSRKETALSFLKRIDGGTIPATEVPLEQARRLTLHRDETLATLIRKHWGNITPGTPEEKLAVMRRLRNDLNAGRGDRTRGGELFKKQCATCHRLFKEGGTTGPDLTGFARQDTDGLLASLVDPSAVVRKEFLAYVATTRRGLIHTGLIAEQDGGTLTLVDAQNNRIKLRREDIEDLKPSATSLMPERLLEGLSPQELRDLFSYLQGSKP
jgi:putative heme-binding domain-containing protein